MLIILMLLLIPLIAMQFTDAINWGFGDFVVATIILLEAALSVDYVVRKVKSRKKIITLIGFVLLGLIFIWVELAVGIF